MVQSGSVTVLNGAIKNGVTHRINGYVSNGDLKHNNNNSDNSDGLPNSKTALLLPYQRVIFVCLFIGYSCYTYNRKSVSYVTPTLISLGLINTNTVGLISSCQNMSYAVSKFLGGVLSDKISARILFSIGLLLSGVSTVLFSTTTSPVLWSILWAVNGFAQGCGWPSCAKLLKKWFSPANFGTWWSVLTASSNASGTLSPLFAAYVIINYSWNFSLVIAGFLSIAMGMLTFVTLVDDPSHLDLPNPAAAAPHNHTTTTTTTTPTDTTKKEERKEGVRELISSPFLWVVCVCYLCVFLTKTAISDWGQLYVMTELGRSQMEASSFTSSMETGGFFGGIFAGIVTDKIVKKVKIRGNVRLLVACAFMCVCALGIHVLSSHLTAATSQVWVSVVGGVVGASVFGPIAIYGIVASESFQPHLSGTAHAIAALSANVGAVLAGWPLSWVSKAVSWSGVMVLLQGLCVFSALLIVTTTRTHITTTKQKIK